MNMIDYYPIYLKKEKTIKELENKSFIIYVDHMGRIKYINNSTENVQKVYDNLVERDKVFLEKYKSEIDRRDSIIMDLEIKNKLIINSIKLQIKQYNEQGGFARLVSKFVLKDFKY